MFTVEYTYVKAHQDNKTAFCTLSWKAQLNCMCDHMAKVRILADRLEANASGKMFPIEPVGIFVGDQKMTSDTGDHTRFWAHKKIARKYFKEHKILTPEQFNQVDWKSTHSTLHSLPRLFQLWASKHVLGVAGTAKFLSHQDGRSPLSPSCLTCIESC